MNDHLHTHEDHCHAHTYELDEKTRLTVYLKAWGITWIIALIELSGSLLSGSVALLSDISHVVTDTIVGLAPVSVEITKKKSPFSKENIERIGGILVSVFLAFISYSILFASHDEEHEVHGVYMLLFSLIAAICNYIQHRILSQISSIHRHSAHAGFHFHILTDLAKNLLIPAVAIIIMLGGPDIFDHYLSRVIGIIILIRSIVLFSEALVGHNITQKYLSLFLSRLGK
jgi:cobalt-zinc-cadmium efflux system protein